CRASRCGGPAWWSLLRRRRRGRDGRGSRLRVLDRLLQLTLGLLDQLERLGAVSAEVVFGLLDHVSLQHLLLLTVRRVRLHRCRDAAVEVDGGAGDVGRALRGEERDEIGELARLAEAPER